jgi:NAD-dependent DNA ligase
LPLPVFLTALGIDEIGPTVAETICAVYPSWDALQAATEGDLSNIHGVGPSIAKSLVDGLRARSDEISDLLREVQLESAPLPVETDHPISGKSVVFTGKMARMDRKAAQKKVRELGGKTPSGVSRDLDYLVVGDEGSPLLGDGKKSTKQVSAEKHIANGASIQLISESEFATIIEGKS